MGIPKGPPESNSRWRTEEVRHGGSIPLREDFDASGGVCPKIHKTSEAVQTLVMRAGIVVKVTRADRHRLEAIVAAGRSQRLKRGVFQSGIDLQLAIHRNDAMMVIKRSCCGTICTARCIRSE